jgi:3-phosphoshikimate 1-carboxyvinyltransferase
MGARFTMGSPSRTSSGGPNPAEGGDCIDVSFQPADLHAPASALDCANSGTTIRLLAATAACLSQPVILTGDESLRRRPHAALASALQERGVLCQTQVGGGAPMLVRGAMRPGPGTVDATGGSQAASAMMLSLPFLAGDSTLHVRGPIASRPYLDVTRQVATQAGLRFDWLASGDGLQVGIPGGQRTSARHLRVEGDWSSASFLLAAGAIAGTRGGGPVEVAGLDPASAQGDAAIVRHLTSYGAACHVAQGGVTCEAGSGELASPGRIDLGATPDLFPVLAAVAATSRGTTTLAGAAHLRHKESDRIAAMADGLRRLGAGITEHPDGMTIAGARLRGTTLSSAGDHRIHMALCVAALTAEGPSLVDGAATPAISFPGFHDALRSLGARLGPATTVPA